MLLKKEIHSLNSYAAILSDKYVSVWYASRVIYCIGRHTYIRIAVEMVFCFLWFNMFSSLKYVNILNFLNVAILKLTWCNYEKCVCSMYISLLILRNVVTLSLVKVKYVKHTLLFNNDTV